mgnify:CR=1 FL=1
MSKENIKNLLTFLNNIDQKIFNNVRDLSSIDKERFEKDKAEAYEKGFKEGIVKGKAESISTFCATTDSLVTAHAISATMGAYIWNLKSGPKPLKPTISLSISTFATPNALGRNDGWGDKQKGLLSLADELWRVRGYGDFWSHLLVAEGAIDIAAEPSLALWDMAPLSIIVKEAGGRFSDFMGVDGPNGANAVTTNGILHEEVLGIFAKR